jgi:uncharacterized membrane protein YfcA
MLLTGVPAVILGSFTAIEIPDAIAKIALGGCVSTLWIYDLTIFRNTSCGKAL